MEVIVAIKQLYSAHLTIKKSEIWQDLVSLYQGAQYESTNFFLSFEIYNVNYICLCSYQIMYTV
jgi:hypothetical protein